jgi:hypothetical protein
MDSLKNKQGLKTTILWVVIFSIAMGFMEGAVVVYLREIYYPKGFSFPLATISDRIALTELLREAATVIMLSIIGMIAGRTKLSSFAYFLLSFAVWDIVYYLVLKMILDWPESVFTWDILFLIPVPWLGPVLAPILISIGMIVLAIVVLRKENLGIVQKFSKYSILFFAIGCSLILWSFMSDYINIIQINGISSFWIPGSSRKLLEEINTFIPVNFNWILFSMGYVLILLGILKYKLQR